jgi:hypothetical protein
MTLIMSDNGISRSCRGGYIGEFSYTYRTSGPLRDLEGQESIDLSNCALYHPFFLAVTKSPTHSGTKPSNKLAINSVIGP